MTQSMTPQSTKDILNDSRLSNVAYQKALIMAQMVHEVEKLNQPNVKLIF